MYLGTRPIRTAGRGSGSVEVTLPAQLRPMVGLACAIKLHDGARPAIVMTPDLSRARAAFASLWARLVDAAGLGATGRPWPEDDFALGLSACPCLPGQPNGQPGLAWADGLTLAAGEGTDAALGRAVYAMLLVSSAAQGISPAAAPLFAGGGAVLCGGHVLCPEWRRGADLAVVSLPAALWRPGAAWAAHPDWRQDGFWADATPALRAMAQAALKWPPAAARHGAQGTTQTKTSTDRAA